jgi:DNA-binding response OmpR family regulator
MNLLIIEDDHLLGDGMKTVLTQQEFQVHWAQDGLSGDQALRKGSYDLVLLDLNLPGMSGLQVLQRLRAAGSTIPVLVLTARSEVSDRVRALDDGADDYLVKPFDVAELCARIRALHRRSLGQMNAALHIGELRLDTAARQVLVGKQPVQLSGREFDVLQLLMENAGRVMSRQRLEEAVYGWSNEVESNAVEVHIHHLRKKLGINPIRTVRGVGYIIEKAA